MGGHTFDSNCITPGTEFMARLSEHLLFFTRKKMAEDPAWRVPAIVFSGPDVPGEGRDVWGTWGAEWRCCGCTCSAFGR